MPRMNNHVKLVFALEHIAHLSDLIEGNKWEKYMRDPLHKLEFELERQLKNEEDKRKVSS